MSAGPMAQAKPLASLTATLLARKGEARPAMRPQLPVEGGGAVRFDDLGWNDLGPEPTRPEVLAQRERLTHAIETAAAPVLPPATAERLRGDARRTGKAAFTLRLDSDRHVRLKLASAITNRSAQRILIDALDALLAGSPEIEALAARLSDDATPFPSSPSR